MPSTPRKSPRQSRSRATVDAIVEATAQVALAHRAVVAEPKGARDETLIVETTRMISKYLAVGS